MTHRPTLHEREQGRLEVARLRVASAERRARRLAVDPDTNPRVLAARAHLAELEADQAATDRPVPQPRHRRDVDGPPEE